MLKRYTRNGSIIVFFHELSQSPREDALCPPAPRMAQEQAMEFRALPM
ncbi:hypothetical protein [Duncaniella dubosii]